MNTRLVRFLAALTVTAAVAAGCGDDSAPSAESSTAVTTAAPATTETTPATTAAPTTTQAPTTTEAPTTTVAPTTTEAPAPTWSEVDEMPSLAYLPCCASNYVGEPSPPIPADGSAALAPGIYKAFRQQPPEGEAFDPATIEFSLAPFVPCGTPDVYCEEPYVDGEVGVDDVARQVAMPLTDDVRVVVGGFRCEADGITYVTDTQAGTGSLLATMQAEFEAAFAETVAPLVADTPFEDYATIFATPINGFSVPCSFAGVLQWQGSAGPALLLQSVAVYDDALGELVVPASMSIPILHLTAYEMGDDGTETLYFYAGFLS